MSILVQLEFVGLDYIYLLSLDIFRLFSIESKKGSTFLQEIEKSSIPKLIGCFRDRLKIKGSWNNRRLSGAFYL